MSNVTTPPEVYQLHVWLREISPMISRRLLVRSDSTIADLHYILQIVMGWEGYHLHQFIIRGKSYGVPQPGGMGFPEDPTTVHLADLRLRLRERFLYAYDFGDLWQHEIRVEKKLPVQPRRRYPTCIGGQRATPPEDCGGP
jgi:Plasmid pRiA4b ORF-3-like protein